MRYVLVNAILIGLAEMAQRRLRAKIGDLRQAVPGRFNNHHARMVKELLAHIDYLSAAVDRLDEQIDVMMVPFVAARIGSTRSRASRNAPPKSSSRKSVST